MDERPVVLFVCTGNTCRSPMAEAYLKSKGYSTAFSRGILANEGDPISENAALALRYRGILSEGNNCYESHTAKNITVNDIASADIVVAISPRHAASLMFSFPQFASKVTVLGNGIPDPYGGSLETYKYTLEKIIEETDKMFI